MYHHIIPLGQYKLSSPGKLQSRLFEWNKRYKSACVHLVEYSQCLRIGMGLQFTLVRLLRSESRYSENFLSGIVL